MLANVEIDDEQLIQIAFKIDNEVLFANALLDNITASHLRALRNHA